MLPLFLLGIRDTRPELVENGGDVLQNNECFLEAPRVGRRDEYLAADKIHGYEIQGGIEGDICEYDGGQWIPNRVDGRLIGVCEKAHCGRPQSLVDRV